MCNTIRVKEIKQFMPNTDLLLKYESDNITEEEFLQLFQDIYDTAPGNGCRVTMAEL